MNLVANNIVSAVLLLIILPCLLHETKSITSAFTCPTASTKSLHHHHHESSERYVILAATNRKNNNYDDSSSSSSSSSTTAGVTDDGVVGQKQNRKPWDIFRFVSQSSKFIRPPSLPRLIVFGGKKNKRLVRSGRYYVRFFLLG